MKKFIPMYDLSALTEQQKQDYVVALCEHLEIPPELNLVRLIWDDDGSTSRKQVAYVLKGGTDIIRANRKITTKSLTNVVLGGAVVFTCTGEDGNGRQEIAVGSKSIDGLQGKALDDSIMTAQTRSTRRMTLQFVGGGVLDESEVNQATTNLNSQSTPLAELSLAPAQPTVKLNDAPGADVTEAAVEIGKAAVAAAINGPQAMLDAAKEQVDFVAAQKKLREDAIAFLNEKPTPGGEAAAGPEPVKKRRGRGPAKPKSALTPEDLKNQMPLPMAVSADPVIASTTIIVPEIVPQVSAAPTQANPVKGLTAEQVKPYRQRLFRLNNDHFEQNGLIQKEGLGRSEQLRMLASLMFPGVTNFNEMTVEQWEKYLGNLEDRVKKDGAVETVKYIQESIGI
jgi:hypothetical protein